MDVLMSNFIPRPSHVHLLLNLLGFLLFYCWFTTRVQNRDAGFIVRQPGPSKADGQVVDVYLRRARQSPTKI